MTEYSDDKLRSILRNAKSIAMVGVSTNPVRPSYFVGRYLVLKGYDVFPVNPAYAGQELFGRPIVESLSDVEQSIDLVDIFRRSEHVPEIVDEALQASGTLQTIWMQIGVEHAGATVKAEAAGVEVIQNRCPKIEYQRLFGELRMGGFATGVISSKL